ncbi:helix-turn-helix transcriptional regulator [Aerococcus urinae]|uniref:helix-turn-helix domain-containing protein n=1 Tax=Aerococcus urinae TaxID=1376 RepID=UPI0025506DF2|nr:helix-turn-helix transcriptional regulator [Aerococcus urinae]MDK6291402.1 helix-turn-helix transcriptional regulator [Aerococcus urinae]
MDINKDKVGKRIKKIRTDRGWSLEVYGEKIEDPPVKPGIISRWENGKSLPNNQRIKAIADIGGITVDELLHGNQKDRLFNLLCSAIDENSELYSISLIDKIIKFLNFYDNLIDKMLSIGDSETSSKIEEQAIISFFHNNLDNFIKYTKDLGFNLNFDQPEQIINKFIRYVDLASMRAKETYEGAEAVIQNALESINPYLYTKDTFEEFINDEDYIKWFKNKSEAAEKYFISKLYENVQETVIEVGKKYWDYRIDIMNDEEDQKE